VFHSAICLPIIPAPFALPEKMNFSAATRLLESLNQDS
jgi:hypothetical protein